jgi:hypothetical protein
MSGYLELKPTQKKDRAMRESVECEAKPSRMNKHQDIYLAIQDINTVVDCLEQLLMSISGPVIQEPEKVMAQLEEPTLSEFLARSSDDIRNKLDSAHSLINKISAELF